MQEKTEVKNLFAESICERLSTLFLHCVFTNPEFIKDEVSKHLHTSIDKVKFELLDTIINENGEELSKHYRLCVFGTDITLIFDKKVEEPKEIEVPKVVNKPKKWWEVVGPDTMVVVEKKKTSDKPTIRWVLKVIDC